jgi:branched-chain amino acid transport system ATP-binding protein
MAFFEIKELSRAFGGLKAVDRVSFSAGRGEIKAVIGPNGAGKTTLFNLIAGSLRPDAGQVFFEKRPVHGLLPHQIATRGIARTFQNTALFARMTVLENVMTGMHTLSRTGFFSAMARLPGARKEEARMREKARAILEFLGLADLSHVHAGHLPAGRQRMAALARALSAGPRLMLLDEPAAGLNTGETAALAGCIRKIRAQGATLLIVEHDMPFIMDIAGEIVVLNNGQKIAEGTPAEIRQHPEVVRAYLGEAHD